MEVSYGNKPSALIPAVMSLVALLLFLIQLMTHGAAPVRAERVVAYLYLLLVVAQLPFIAFFGYRWFREAPLRGMPVVLSQAIALAAALVPMHMMGW
ncbi:MAG: hypothetical protein ABSF50_05845 [Burkholderiaceae bacterium]|jgi:hypothetical protein